MIKTPRKTEYRGSIGPAVRSVLVFKGGTKIGMIPTDFVSKNLSLLDGGFSCIVSEIYPERKRIVVELKRL